MEKPIYLWNIDLSSKRIDRYDLFYDEYEKDNRYYQLLNIPESYPYNDTIKNQKRILKCELNSIVTSIIDFNDNERLLYITTKPLDYEVLLRSINSHFQSSILMNKIEIDRLKTNNKFLDRRKDEYIDLVNSYMY